MVFSLLEACYILSSALKRNLKHTSHLRSPLKISSKELNLRILTSVNKAICGLEIDDDAYGSQIPKVKPLSKAVQLLISQSIIHSLRLLWWCCTYCSSLVWINLRVSWYACHVCFWPKESLRSRSCIALFVNEPYNINAYKETTVCFLWDICKMSTVKDRRERTCWDG